MRRIIPALVVVGLATFLFLAPSQAQKNKPKAPPTWTVIKVEFKGPDRIQDPPPPKGAKPGPPNKTPRRFEFGPDGGRVVEGDAKEVPYITIGHVPNFTGAPNEFKVVDALGQELAYASTYVVGRNNQDTLVFKRDHWKEFGELFLEGPDGQRIPLSKFLPPEEQAAWKLKSAKILVDGGEKDKAKEACQQILKQFPKTRAAKEAQQLLGQLRK